MLYEGAQSMFAFEEMVMAPWAMQIVRRPRGEKGDCSAGASVGCDHVPHLD
jgi:hypothetical protein